MATVTHMASVVLAAMISLASSSISFAQQPRRETAAQSSGRSDLRSAAAIISRYRVANGLSSVVSDSRLTAAAQSQARTVAESGVLDHGDFAARMVAFGIRGKASENLALGLDSVEQVIAYWQTSPGHNANLLMPEFKRIGIARVDAARPFWALVMAR